LTLLPAVRLGVPPVFCVGAALVCLVCLVFLACWSWLAGLLGGLALVLVWFSLICLALFFRLWLAACFAFPFSRCHPAARLGCRHAAAIVPRGWWGCPASIQSAGEAGYVQRPDAALRLARRKTRVKPPSPAVRIQFGRICILAPVSAVASRLQLCLADEKSLLGINSVRSAATDFQIVSGSAIHLFP